MLLFSVFELQTIEVVKMPKNLYSVLFWAPLSHRMIHAVDFSSLSKFKRSLNRVDISAFLWYA